MSKIWFITGATRGIGAQIAQAALLAGDSVVVTGRHRDALIAAFGEDSDRLLSLALDVTNGDQARAAAEKAVAYFGRIDVLVNNAGYGVLGLFEETTDEQARAQYETNIFGLMNVTRAVLPVMRRQRSGHIFNVSSLGGIVGSTSGSLYCGSKFAVEGFSEALADEVATFGIRVTIVEPGFFRTDFLDATSAEYASAQINDYAHLSADLRRAYAARNHNQAGDPAKLARAITSLAKDTNPPLRFLAGSDAVASVRQKIGRLQTELNAWESLSTSTDATADLEEVTA
jgi:NAD(P)-dependent dehydrogenase (short-subunit alcohol dehydrogenase family)